MKLEIFKKEYVVDIAVKEYLKCLEVEKLITKETNLICELLAAEFKHIANTGRLVENLVTKLFCLKYWRHIAEERTIEKKLAVEVAVKEYFGLIFAEMSYAEE